MSHFLPCRGSCDAGGVPLPPRESRSVTAGHWRTRDDDEVDLVLERHDGAVVAIEIKAGEQVDGKQLAGLRRLRDRLGTAFVAGIAFHLGQVGYPAEDRIHVVPVDRLWT